MVRLWCVLVGVMRSRFSVEVCVNESVESLKRVIWEVIKDEFVGDTAYKCVLVSNVQLFPAIKCGGEWFSDDDPVVLQLEDGEIPLQVQKMMQIQKKMMETRSVAEFLKQNNMETPAARQIHVLVKVSPRKRIVFEEEQRAVKKMKTLVTEIQDEKMQTIAADLKLETWGVGGRTLSVWDVESDFPKWFYVRKETLDIIQIVQKHLEEGLSTVFVGASGVGKSMLVVLFAFYMALYQQKRVVLFRKIEGKGFSMLCMDVKNKSYRRVEEAEISDLDLVKEEDFELILDGLTQKDVKTNFGRLARFRLLATPVPYLMKNDDVLLWRCLVPFWSRSDLNSIGTQLRWTEDEIKEKYFYSGGNLRDFLSSKIKIIESINEALSDVDENDAALFNPRYTLSSKEQVDWIRMTSIPPRPTKENNLDKYKLSTSWVCAVTSEYALRQLGSIVTPSYYKTLWSKGQMLGDDGLMEIALKNYVHTMARDGTKIELQVREYTRQQQNQLSYAAVEFKANSYRNEGRDATGYEAIMKQLQGIDYWYPLDRCSETIDCVAKLNMGGQDVVGLIRITTSANLKMDAEALDKYAKLFPNGCHIALVPDKETSDKFQFSPADLPTLVPLNVAYIPTWNQ